jgi:hypothetical protein
MADLRRHLEFAARPFKADQCSVSGLGDYFYIYTATRNLVNYGILLNLYQDLMDGQDVPGVSTQGQRYTQAAITLGYLLVEQILTSVHINAIDVRDASKNMVDHITRACVRALMFCTEQELSKFEDAHLWALYVGWISAFKLTRVKSSQVETAEEIQPNLRTLRPLLQDQMARMGLETWPDIRVIARSFIHSERVMPLERIWFESQFPLVTDEL